MELIQKPREWELFQLNFLLRNKMDESRFLFQNPLVGETNHDFWPDAAFIKVNLTNRKGFYCPQFE